MISSLEEESTLNKIVGINYMSSNTNTLIKLPKDNFKRKVDVRATILLNETSILNIGLIFTNKENKEEWIFGRFDSRKTAPSNMDGIFTKTDNQSWVMSAETRDVLNSHTEANKKIAVRFTFLNGSFHLYKKGRKIASFPTKLTNLKNIIIFNEIEDVLISKLSINTK